jgi:tRNA dimethylallyltransferase
LTGDRPLVVILGPTAVGKTGLSLRLAREYGGEIVGADSRQIYRHMTIGAAKPTPEEQARAPHHLIDVVEPDQSLSLAEYQRMAYDVIAGIHARGRLPLLVGGTGQYITAVVEGWTIPEVPPNAPLRAELEALAAEQGGEALLERLRALDPEAARRVDPRNIRRVTRAIEIAVATGGPMDYTRRKQPPPYRTLQLGLTMDRERLYARADARLDQMLRDGFLEEVRGLLAMGYGRELPSMSGLGYRELAAFLAGESTLDEALAATRRATRDFIRRQYTWFRGHDQGIEWIDVEATAPERVAALVGSWLAMEPR